MAAVTVNSQRTNVDGSYREKLFSVTIATSGDTLVTGLKTIRAASANDVAITKLGVSGGTITFTTTGAVTAALIDVIGI